MPAEEQVCLGERPLCLVSWNGLIVDGNAAAFDVFAGLALAGGKAGGDQGLNQGKAGIQGWEGEGGDFACQVSKYGLRQAFEPAAKQHLGGFFGLEPSCFAVQEVCHGAGQCGVCLARLGAGAVGDFEGLNFRLVEKGEEFEELDDIAVIDADPELVEAVDGGAFGVEPDGSRDSFAELGAIGIGEEGECEPVGFTGVFFCGRGRYRR